MRSSFLSVGKSSFNEVARQRESLARERSRRRRRDEYVREAVGVCAAVDDDNTEDIRVR